MFSVLKTGLLGLVDLITEPSGVGAVAADFQIKEDEKGEVASGRLKLLGPDSSGGVVGQALSATLIEQSGKTSVTAVGTAVETGNMAIA